MKAILLRLVRDNLHSSLQVFHSAGNIRIAFGPAGLAVTLEIHRPNIETVACKFVHQRILAMTGDGQVERPRRRG